MKSSMLPIAAGILGVGAIIYIYLKQRDKDKQRKPTDGSDNSKEDATIETLEFKVENSQVPLIVGRNSVNLKSIEEKTKTAIRFRECDGEHQMCMIRGKAADVKLAKQLIDVEKTKPAVITDELLVPTSSCGKIEGYYGSVLQEICQKSSAKVWVDPGARKTQGENRRVLITGTKEQVELAKKLIEEKIKEPPPVMPSETLSVEEEEKKDDAKKSPRGSLSPFGSNTSITATDTPREVMLPSPERLRNNDGRLEVFVSSCATPSRFWVQLCGQQNTELDFLVDAMTEYYNEKENQELHKIREPYLGQIVAAMFLADNRWYRAEVVAIEPNESNELVLDVYFLDYGDQQYVGKKEILEIRADFLSLRFQAIECFLAHVQPTNTGSRFEEWDRQSIAAFESLVQAGQNKKMISKVVTYKERKSFVMQRSNQRESSPVPGVELYEEDTDKNIALELVRMGHAEISDRFGDLAKSSVLVVKQDDDNSKEPKPEPAQKAPEPKKEVKFKQGDEIIEPKETSPEPNSQLPPTPPAAVDPPIQQQPQPQVVPFSKESVKQPVDTLTPTPTPAPVNLPEKIVEEKPPKKPAADLDPVAALSNGKPKSDDPFGNNNNNSSSNANNNNNNVSKPMKGNKKKKQQMTADFLRNEQANATKGADGDWN